ncbi:SDR family NAD(P)-dependent oxidoreductase [Streptomyces sp. NPDC088400]|uniref:SDR family NAD(P)-dependent oxidoreductase n=1 Tax=Streptomyces sp. NPDC088400 TaxID=3365861 RepID=UPI003801E535
MDRGGTGTERPGRPSRAPDAFDDLIKTHGDNLLPIQLDATDRAAVDVAVRQAADRFGRLDVVVNNVGYGLFGMVEEISEEQARAQIEVEALPAIVRWRTSTFCLTALLSRWSWQPAPRWPTAGQEPRSMW